VSHLQSLDAELFKHLMFLKNYSGSWEDLCLSFTVSDAAFGISRELELIPNGKNIDVTSANSKCYDVQFS